MDSKSSAPAGRAQAFLTPLGAWALSLGCAVGWGAFMMPGNSFLPVAGPLGTVIGIVIGVLIMLIVAVNYQYMLDACPNAGGAFSYVVQTLDFDHGFVAAWFLLLTYIAIVWANATALPLIGRFLLGNVFQVGGHYEIAGFSIYVGELALSIGALVLLSLLCLRRKAAVWFQTVMVFLLCGGVLICAVAVFRNLDGGLASIKPSFAPGRDPMRGVLTIVAMGPWAFVGFESISHSAGEFKFPTKKALPIMACALAVGGALYAVLAVIAASTPPEGFSDWPAYIAALDTLDRSQAAPTFYAVRTALGPIGTPILVVTVLGGVLTGLVGNTIAASRLLYALAKEGLLPKPLAALNKDGAPKNAIFLILGVSVFMPLFGRTAIGWIVDVTTVGAAIVYAYVSGCALKRAQQMQNSNVTATGLLGVLISLVFLLYYLIPNLLSVSALGRESYLMLSIWSLLGLIFFRFLLVKDTERRMGHSTIVWIVTLSLVFFTSLVWMRQSSTVTAHNSIDSVGEYYQELTHHHAERSQEELAEDAAFLDSQKSGLEHTLTKNSIIQISFMVLSMVTLFNIYGIIHRREKQIEREKVLAEESSRAKTSFLSNMSHEIRTPMNAIIGLDAIALKEPDLSPRTREQLEKIGASANHLLGLINDILDMSRIESGKMALKEEVFSFRDFLDQINVIVNGQCQDKGLEYECHIVGKVGESYTGDALKLRQVLINILGNAVKFTNKPGSVSLTVEQTAAFESYCTLRFVIKDTGIGMSKDFIPKIFDAFSQENTSYTSKYNSTGLGMAITKNLVQMMNGDIHVDSEPGVGSTFTVTVTLKAASESAAPDQLGSLPAALRVLVVDDDEIVLAHAGLVLADLGLSADLDLSPTDALKHIREQFDRGVPYELILTDQRMPELDGLGLVQAVRAFDGGRTPIILLTGYSTDNIQDEAEGIGVDCILSKPLFADSLRREIHTLLQRNIDAAVAASLGEDGSLEGLRVLAAEDIDLNAEILTDLLEMEGVSTDRAENGQAAVEMFASHEENYYNAILMDIRMPVMDGLGATAAIRALARADAKRIPIIAMTANAFDDDVQRSLQVGMNAHLSKPIEPDRLYQTLRELAVRRDG